MSSKIDRDALIAYGAPSYRPGDACDLSPCVTLYMVQTEETINTEAADTVTVTNSEEDVEYVSGTSHPESAFAERIAKLEEFMKELDRHNEPKSRFGWECPKCGSCFSPDVDKCRNCGEIAE